MPRVIIYMKKRESPLSHSVFQDHRTLVMEKIFFKFFTIYGYDRTFGHFNKTIYINECPLSPRKLYIKN